MNEPALLEALVHAVTLQNTILFQLSHRCGHRARPRRDRYLHASQESASASGRLRFGWSVGRIFQFADHKDTADVPFGAVVF